MKTKHYLVFVFFFGLWACSSKPVPNLELSNPEAFAFDLEDSWEVNGSVNATGFQQNEVNDNFKIKLSYSVDIITADSDTLFSIYDDIIDEGFDEELMDFILEAQIEIDFSFGEGDYKLVFHVKDEFSNQTKSIEVGINLTK